MAHFITFQDLLKDWLKDNVKSVYGGVGGQGGEAGPFSIRSYLKYMVQDKVWGTAYSLV